MSDTKPQIDNIPKTIFIQVGEELETPCDFNTLECSWCVDQIYDNDIRYVLDTPQPEPQMSAEEYYKAWNDNWNQPTGPLMIDFAKSYASQVTKEKDKEIEELNKRLSLQQADYRVQEKGFESCHRNYCNLEDKHEKLQQENERLREVLGDFYNLITSGLIKVYTDEEINIQEHYSAIEQALTQPESKDEKT